jgi:hypothetical protein
VDVEGTQVTTENCKHHYILPDSQEPEVTGVCKLCGDRKWHQNQPGVGSGNEWFVNKMKQDRDEYLARQLGMDIRRVYV